jgi:hypothetical protein
MAKEAGPRSEAGPSNIRSSADGPPPREISGRMRKPPRWVQPFLRALERTGEVRTAAADAGIDHTTAYQRRKSHADFGGAWAAALKAHGEQKDRAREAEMREVVETLRNAPSPGSPSARPTSPAEGGAEFVVRPLHGGGGKLVKAGSGRWSKKAEQAFLAELAASASIKRACEAAGFSRETLNKRRLKDRHFAAAWDAAVEMGKAEVQAYLVEATKQTFDPAELPGPDESPLPKVSVSEAINIARLKGPGENSAARKSTHEDPFFDGWEEDHQEYLDACGRLKEKIARLGELSREKQMEKGWTLAEQEDVMVPPGWARPEQMAVEDSGCPRLHARWHCPHCGGGLKLVLPRSQTAG